MFNLTRNGFPRTQKGFPTGKGFPTEISLLSGKRFLTGKWLPPWRVENGQTLPKTLKKGKLFPVEITGNNDKYSPLVSEGENLKIIKRF